MSLLTELRERSPGLRTIGLDQKFQSVSTEQGKGGSIQCIPVDLTQRLPLADNSVDIGVTESVVRYLSDDELFAFAAVPFACKSPEASCTWQIATTIQLVASSQRSSCGRTPRTGAAVSLNGGGLLFLPHLNEPVLWSITARVLTFQSQEATASYRPMESSKTK